MNMIEINRNFNENCLDTMVRMPNDFIDLVVTSPPYDNLRTYNGYSFPFQEIAKELFRVMKVGGVIVWVVKDETINKSETLTSFKQALYFKELGFFVETMIYRKLNYKPIRAKRYDDCFEYMFVFSKGEPKTFNPLTVKKQRTRDNEVAKMRQYNGTFKNQNTKNSSEYKKRTNIFDYSLGGHIADKIAFKHPAIFSEQLAKEHILSWSNEGDLVYDPFMGSGTTAKMALLNNRNFIGSEISPEYCEIIHERLKSFSSQLSMSV